MEKLYYIQLLVFTLKPLHLFLMSKHIYFREKMDSLRLMKRALPAYCAIYVIDIGIQLSNSSKKKFFHTSFHILLKSIVRIFLLFFIDIENKNKQEKNNKNSSSLFQTVNLRKTIQLCSTCTYRFYLDRWSL